MARRAEQRHSAAGWPLPNGPSALMERVLQLGQQTPQRPRPRFRWSASWLDSDASSAGLSSAGAPSDIGKDVDDDAVEIFLPSSSSEASVPRDSGIRVALSDIASLERFQCSDSSQSSVPNQGFKPNEGFNPNGGSELSQVSEPNESPIPEQPGFVTGLPLACLMTGLMLAQFLISIDRTIISTVRQTPPPTPSRPSSC